MRPTLVVDFDDTLVRTACAVTVQRRNVRWRIPSHEFLTFQIQKGDQLDFRDFESLRRPMPIRSTIRLVRSLLGRGWDGYVCTAREDRRPVERFLQQMQLPLGLVPACNRPELKAVVVRELLRDSTSVLFLDDSQKNCDAVRALAHPNLRVLQVA